MNNTELLGAIGFAFTIVFPNLALMGLGFFMQRKNTIDANFVDVASKLVFNFGLPCLLFFSVIKSTVHYGEQVILLSAGVLTTFILFFGAEIYAKFFVNDIKDKGVFVQGVFRSNMAIISLSVVGNAYGADGTSVGAVYMGVLTILYNVLSVITLSRTQKDKNVTKQFAGILKKIFTNPLIVALASAFIYKALSFPMLPKPIIKTGELLSNIALPLALICAGATLDMKSMFGLSGVSMQGVIFALSPMHFGVLFIMVASPAAAASYVMAKSMGGNDVLAANILAFTTIFSMLGMAIGMAMLRVVGLV